MRLSDNETRYGLVSIILHWTVAAVVFGLFGLGVNMTGLDYYHPWYTRAPLLHKGFGVALFALMIARAAWRVGNTKPGSAPMPVWESKAALFVHRVFYVLLFLIPLSGYLVSTADGRGLEVFGWFDIPAVVSGLHRQEDVAGAIHYYLAVAAVCLAGVHALAAFKHHFVDKDPTLLKMLGVGPKKKNQP